MKLFAVLYRILSQVPRSGPGRVSMKDLCCLFCCPPFPSSIVSKLAFMPPEPSYTIGEGGK